MRDWRSVHVRVYRMRDRFRHNWVRTFRALGPVECADSPDRVSRLRSALHTECGVLGCLASGTWVLVCAHDPGYSVAKECELAPRGRRAYKIEMLNQRGAIPLARVRDAVLAVLKRLPSAELEALLMTQLDSGDDSEL